jgi:hypothetical protein
MAYYKGIIYCNTLEYLKEIKTGDTAIYLLLLLYNMPDINVKSN